MSSVVISGDTSGAITLSAPAVAGTNTINLPAAAGTVALTSGLPASSQLAKAWVNYNAVTQTINSSFNVSSVTYSATGIYIVNFATALTDANYAYTVTSGPAPYFVFINAQANTTARAPTTSSFQFVINNSLNTAQINQNYINVLVFGT
jgi:hypothetical protein